MADLRLPPRLPCLGGAAKGAGLEDADLEEEENVLPLLMLLVPPDDIEHCNMTRIQLNYTTVNVAHNNDDGGGGIAKKCHCIRLSLSAMIFIKRRNLVLGCRGRK